MIRATVLALLILFAVMVVDVGHGATNPLMVACDVSRDVDSAGTVRVFVNGRLLFVVSR